MPASSSIERNGDGDGDAKSEPLYQYVVGRDQVPGVINNDMLNRAIREAQGPSLEQIRLCRDVPIDYATITDLSLEFQNILKIDHLWMLTNLRRLSLKCNKLEKIENLDNLVHLLDLDLSFNYIERIENLECLVRLERLSLFCNNIRRIENLAHLRQMIRLSIGNNLIDSTDGIISLHSMNKLYSLNLDGNPIVHHLDGNVDFRLYIAAHLPDLKYHGYSIITAEERERGRDIFKSELRVLEENRSEELARIESEKSATKVFDHLTECFVENLDKLFERLFSNNQHTECIKSHGIEIDHIVEQYRIGVQKQIDKICMLAKAHYEQRHQEIDLYDESIARSRNAAQSEGIELIANFTAEKNDLIVQVKRVYHAMANSNKGNEAHSQECESLHQKYETLIDNVWYSLMEKETTLHERIAEVGELYSAHLNTIVNQFKKNVLPNFAGIRIASEEYFRMIGEKVKATGKADRQLMEFCESDQKQHLAVIDKRENDLLLQATKWLKTHLDTYTSTENEWNRTKILEIDNFLDSQRAAFNQTLDDLAKQLKLTGVI